MTSLVSSPALRIGERTARPLLSQDRTVPSGTPISLATSATGTPSPSWSTRASRSRRRKLGERVDHREPVCRRSGHVLHRGKRWCQPQMSAVVRREVPHDPSRPGRRVVVAANLSPVDPRSHERLLSEFMRDLDIAGEGECQPDQLRARGSEELVVVGPPRPAHMDPTLTYTLEPVVALQARRNISEVRRTTLSGPQPTAWPGGSGWGSSRIGRTVLLRTGC